MAVVNIRLQYTLDDNPYNIRLKCIHLSTWYAYTADVKACNLFKAHLGNHRA